MQCENKIKNSQLIKLPLRDVCPVISWSSQRLCPPFVKVAHIWYFMYFKAFTLNVCNLFYVVPLVGWPKCYGMELNWFKLNQLLIVHIACVFYEIMELHRNACVRCGVICLSQKQIRFQLVCEFGLRSTLSNDNRPRLVIIYTPTCLNHSFGNWILCTLRLVFFSF